MIKAPPALYVGVSVIGSFGTDQMAQILEVLRLRGRDVVGCRDGLVAHQQ